MSKRSKTLTATTLSLFVASGAVTIVSLRNNSKNAQQLYEALLEADKSGQGVEEALNDLRGYIYAHMNTEIGSDNGIHPPIQLQGMYNRLVTAESVRVKTINDTVYQKAQDTCEAQFGSGELRTGRVQCVEAYIENNSVVEQQVSPDLYRFDFTPPLWSPDLAGYSLLVTIVLGITLVVKGSKTLLRNILSSS